MFEFNNKGIVVVIVGCIIIGWVLNFLLVGDTILTKETQCRTYDGLSIRGNLTKLEALNVSREWDSSGDWICVNVNNMSYQRAVEVCQHEAGHEMFAEILEYHPDKVDAIFALIEDDTEK